MTPEMWIVLGILAGAIILFVTEWLRVDVVALGVVVVLMVSGVLTTDEALSGFANAAVLTIAALFIVGGAVLHTGLAGMIGRRILIVAGTNEVRLFVVLMAAVALLSSFMSDTGTVAVLLPAVIMLARSANVAPSRLLIPLAFGSLLGGASTLIGTPPNIIVSDLLRAEGLEPFQFFSFTPLGIILIGAGIGFMLLFGRRLLPDRRTRTAAERVETPEELVDRYRLPQNMFRLRVRRASDLVGKTIQEVGFGQNYQVTVLDVLRLVEPRAALRLVVNRTGRNGKTPMRVSVEADAGVAIAVDDVLVVQGEGNDVAHLSARWNLGVQRATAADEDALIDDEVGVTEVILPARSRLVGQSLVDCNFGQRYGLTVLGVHRPGEGTESARPEFKDRRLQFGDTLLVQGPWKNIMALKAQGTDFVVTGQPEAMMGPRNREKAGVALVILLGMIALMILDLLPIAAIAMLAGLAMVLSGCLTMDEAYAAIDWKSLVLVAGMLPMSVALEKVGLVDLAATALVDTLGSLAPQAVMAGLFLATSLFTQVLSNTATTVIVAPIALASARTLGIEPYAFLMAVAVAASMAFASPVASPVNTLVMGAGDYRFSDYIKVGAPLIAIIMVIVILVLPLLFSLSLANEGLLQMRLERITRWLLVGSLLLVFGLALDSLAGDSPTMDEQNHLARGLAFLETGDPRLSLEHPPLVNSLSALPVYALLNVQLPLDHPSWNQPQGWYQFAELLLWEYNHDVTRMIFLARLPIVWLTMFLAVAGFHVARAFTRPHFRALRSPWPLLSGLVVFGLFLFDPNILAHGRYTTTDLGGTLFIFVATFLLWQLWRQPGWSWSRLAAATLGLGLAFGSKLSNLVFVPIFILLALLPVYQRGSEESEFGRIARRLVQLAVAGVGALLVVWAIFGFQWASFNFQYPARPTAGEPLASLLGGLNNHAGPIPTFWAGIEQILLLSEGGRATFLLGETSTSGFRAYFPVAFVAKTPLFTLFLTGLALAYFGIRYAVKYRDRNRHDASVPYARARDAGPHTALFLLPAILFFLFSISSNLNIGYRHLLPLLPFLYTFVGIEVAGLARTIVAMSGREARWKTATALIGGFFLLCLLPIARIHPHYLSYFNQAVGGPENGLNVLIDSNVDWGQDLLRLQRWMLDNEVDSVKLAWFGSADPAYYGLSYAALPGLPRHFNLWWVPPAEWVPPFDPATPPPGVYALSASMLWELPLTENKHLFPWFRAREPDDRVGYSILIYEVPE